LSAAGNHGSRAFQLGGLVGLGEQGLGVRLTVKRQAAERRALAGITGLREITAILVWIMDYGLDYGDT